VSYNEKEEVYVLFYCIETDTYYVYQDLFKVIEVFDQYGVHIEQKQPKALMPFEVEVDDETKVFIKLYTNGT
jgi:hypothetical protein